MHGVVERVHPVCQLRCAGRQLAVGGGESFGAGGGFVDPAREPGRSRRRLGDARLQLLRAVRRRGRLRLRVAWRPRGRGPFRLRVAWRLRGRGRFRSPVAWRRRRPCPSDRPVASAPLSARPAPPPSDLAPAAAEARPPRSSATPSLARLSPERRPSIPRWAPSRRFGADASAAWDSASSRCAPATDAGPSTAATSGSRAIASCQCVSASRRWGVVIAPLFGAGDDHERRRPPRSDRAFDHPHRDARRAGGGKLRRVRRAHAQRAGGGRQRQHPGEEQRDRDRGVGDQPFRQSPRSGAPPRGARSG